jgi:D-glycero-beta-D-manno-heptose-7-phosphate kinase
MHRLSLDRTQQILDAASRVRVLVLGDVILDVYLRGVALRISPEAPVPVVRVEEESRAVGGAANVAANINALGARSDLVGCIGADAAGHELLRQLERAAIGTDGIVIAAGRPTTMKTRIMARQQQVARFDHETDVELPEAVCADIVGHVQRLLPAANAVVLEDYNKGLLTSSVIHTVIDAARAADLPVIVDPKSRHFFDYRGCTVFKPNMAELSAALRSPIEPDQRAWLDDVRVQVGCDHLLVTLGEDGMTLLTSDGAHVRLPTAARSVYDVSGAGDTVTAVLGVALAAGASVMEAAMLANHAAGIEVGKACVATVSPDELLAVLEQPLAV